MQHDGKFLTQLGLPSGNAFPTDPTPEDGDVFYRTDHDTLYIYTGAAWDQSRTFGDIGGGNYAQFSTGGVLTLAGTSKRILTLRADLDYTRITAQGKPTQVIVGIFHGYGMPIYNNDDEELFFNENVPGRWDGASNIMFHTLVALAAAETTDETFKFQLSWNQVGETDVVSATTHDVTHEITVVDGTQYATYMLEFTIDYNIDAGDAIVAHDDLCARLRRIASAGDEVDGEIIVLDWYTHYVVDKMFRAP